MCVVGEKEEGRRGEGEDGGEVGGVEEVRGRGRELSKTKAGFSS